MTLGRVGKNAPTNSNIPCQEHPPHPYTHGNQRRTEIIQQTRAQPDTGSVTGEARKNQENENLARVQL